VGVGGGGGGGGAAGAGCSGGSGKEVLNERDRKAVVQRVVETKAVIERVASKSGGPKLDGSGGVARVGGETGRSKGWWNWKSW
jgi:hypothetical protein